MTLTKNNMIKVVAVLAILSKITHKLVRGTKRHTICCALGCILDCVR